MLIIGYLVIIIISFLYGYLIHRVSPKKIKNIVKTYCRPNTYIENNDYRSQKKHIQDVIYNTNKNH